MRRTPGTGCSWVDPATRQTKSVLLKRGNEWHSPIGCC